MGSELITTYHINSVSYYLWAYYDSIEDYDNHKPSFYDLFDEDGYCLNEGDPYYKFPSYDEVSNFIMRFVDVR